jgi:hypothetical protein
VSEWLDLTDHVGAAVITGIVVGPWLDDVWHLDDAAIGEWALGVLRSDR